MTGGQNPEPFAEGPELRGEGPRKPDEGLRPTGEDEASRPAGPAGEEGEALRARSSSSASPSSPSPAGGASAADAEGRAAAEGSDAGAQAVEGDLSALLADAELKRDEYLELARRTQADFENYRKRVANDLKAAAARGKVEMARDVFTALDDLDRALEASVLEPYG